MKIKNILYIILAVLIGMFLGHNIYKGYKSEIKDVFNEVQDEKIYLIQYGVYSNEENMINNTKDLKNYFYYVDDNKYHVLIGITKDKNLKDKIVSTYHIKTDVYLKLVETNNMTFLETLNQYDSLVKETDNEATIINAEKQILSKYEELILRSE